MKIYKKPAYWILIVILTLGVLFIAFSVYRSYFSANDNYQQQAQTLNYTNTKYRYAFDYPAYAIVQQSYENEDIEPIKDSEATEIFALGGKDVDVQIAVWSPLATSTKDSPEAIKFIKEYNIISKKELRDFAQTIGQRFIADKNSDFPNKKISELEEIIFGGKKAYRADITGYPDTFGNDSYSQIYVNNGNYNMIIKYSKLKISSQKIIDSFRFTK